MIVMNNPVSKDPKDYPNGGLFYSQQHLKNVITKIAFFPIEKQAEYADAICIAMVSNHERLFEKGDTSVINEQLLEKLHATNVGNLAYAVMNSSSVTEVRNAMKILELFKIHMTKKLRK